MTSISIPKGIPSVTYVRLQSSISGSGDVITDGSNTLTVLEPGHPSTRHEVGQVLDKGLSDQEACEYTIGPKAGAGLGVVLNPVGAFVNDAASAVIFIMGSKATRKVHFVKKVFLPFLANELMSLVAEKEQQEMEFYQAHISLSSFEIQDEIITDLLRPSNRGLGVSITADSGICIPGLYEQVVFASNTT